MLISLKNTAIDTHLYNAMFISEKKTECIVTSSAMYELIVNLKKNTLFVR